VILQCISDWQCDIGDWSGKNTDFFTYWLPWQSLADRKKLNEVNKPFRLSTIHEILVGPLESELPGLKSRPLKKGKTLAKYSPFGKFAERAK